VKASDKRLPWGMFYWADYAADPQLKLCSLAAQGLWMRMLCVAAEHEGYVAVNDRALGAPELARMCGEPVELIEQLLVELEGNGVFSRDRHGTIFSRRMINDRKRRQTAKKNGKLGGNPKLRKQRENSGQDNLEDKPHDKPRDKPQSPESRVQSIPSSNEDGRADDFSNDPTSPDFDPVKALFDTGIRVLGAAGVKQPTARSLIGKWRKDHGDDPVALALAAAEAQHISQPLEWIPKWLASRAKSKPAASTGDNFLDVMAREFLPPKETT
jgi:hypothetical protein